MNTALEDIAVVQSWGLAYEEAVDIIVRQTLADARQRMAAGGPVEDRYLEYLQDLACLCRVDATAMRRCGNPPDTHRGTAARRQRNAVRSGRHASDERQAGLALT